MEILQEVMIFIRDQGVATALVGIAVFNLQKHMPTFMKNHARIADASIDQVTLGNKLVTAVTGLETKVSQLSAKVESVEAGLTALTQEVKNHPPTKEKTGASTL